MKRHCCILIGFTGILSVISLRGGFAEEAVDVGGAGRKQAGAVSILLSDRRVSQQEEPSSLRQQLLKVDALRAGASTQYAEVENHGRALLLQYTHLEEQAQIYFAITEVYAQSDIRRHSERVTHYARLALAREHDPIRRGILYSYLGSAAEVDPTRLTFAEQRRQAAREWLQGYKELLTLHLPTVAPELPVVEKVNDLALDPAQREALLKKHTEQMKARSEAERLGALVANREVFIQQLTEVYRREPRATEEFKHITAQVLKDKQAMEALLVRVLKPSGVISIP